MFSRAQYVVYLSSLALIAFAVPSLLWPDWTAALAGFGIESATARTEIRAFYGGLGLGLGALLLAWARRPALLGPALWLSLMAFGGIAAGRAFGVAVDGDATSFTVIALAVELVIALLAAAALLNLGRSQEPLRGVMTAIRARD